MTFKTQKDGPKCPEPSCGAKATAAELRAIIELQPDHTELLEMLEKLQNQDNTMFETLISKMQKQMPEILQELQEKGKKTKPWIWWVMPTEKPPTSVRKDQLGDLLQLAPDTWQQVLELIAKLVKEKNGALEEIITQATDRTRVAAFCALWRDYADRPAWLDSVITTLS